MAPLMPVFDKRELAVEIMSRMSRGKDVKGIYRRVSLLRLGDFRLLEHAGRPTIQALDKSLRSLACRVTLQ